MSSIRVISIEGTPLSTPLRDPFVIASGRIDAIRAMLIHATIETDTGARATGLGEAAALPPVTREDQPDLLRALAGEAPALTGTRIADHADLQARLEAALVRSVVVRAGVEAAILDAWARAAGVPLARALAGAQSASLAAAPLLTDITLSISSPEQMLERALAHHAAGFSCFKVKVGLDWRADRDALLAVAGAVPGARFRLDANGGFSARDALVLLDAILGAGLVVECYEQPCARGDLQGLAEVKARTTVPVVADESFRDEADLAALIDRRAADAVNLKLVKLGGPLRALALGRRARAAGLRLMAGAMVESRVGLLAMAHVVTALGGVDWVDLDTAFLLAEDPFEGGWRTAGPLIELTGEPGLGVRQRQA
ncbi:MAG TPA: dipeptide epimerase [Polyangia bacterium]